MEERKRVLQRPFSTKGLIVGVFVVCLLVFGAGLYLAGKSRRESTTASQVKLPSAIDPHLQLSGSEFLKFCQQDPAKVYQDIVIKGQTRFQGVNLCENRYLLLKPLLENLGKENFSVLDVGAGQGYFSFKIAHDFPKAHCYMIEHANKSYDHHARMLYQLCLLNDFPNVTFFHKTVSVPVLEWLNDQVHFDVILALLVVHQMDDSMEIRKMAIENLLKLGNHVILEVSNDVAPELLDFVKNELKDHSEFECTFPGEVPRYYDPATAYGGKYPDGKGEFYYFRRKNPGPTSTEIAHHVFSEMNRIYPCGKTVSNGQ